MPRSSPPFLLSHLRSIKVHAAVIILLLNRTPEDAVRDPNVTLTCRAKVERSIDRARVTMRPDETTRG